MFSLMKTDKLINIVSGSLVSLPSPANISYMWNMGSLLGICLGVQLGTGIFLAMHYCADVSTAFFSVSHIMRDVNYGWILRIIHANGASMFFLFLYLHVGRGIYYSSFKLFHTWSIGVSIFLAVMATAFLGYVLPWGQMSFWGATVITNLFSAVPFLGNDIVAWLWGGFSVANPTLTRFFSLHYLIPFIIAALVMIHLLYLHQTGSNNPLGISSNIDKIQFHPYFSSKDLLGATLFFLLFFILCCSSPWMLGDPENFISANPLVTPIHIQPEWYFLFAYAILRSIPNKLGGVVALLLSVLVLYTLPLMSAKTLTSPSFNPTKKVVFWFLVNIWIILTWIGARPVEDPYIIIGQVFTILYFWIFLIWSWI